MNAIVYYNYGSPDVLKMVELPKPTPKDDEVLIKVHATGINAADWRMMRADPFLIRFFAGLLKPKNPILGSDVVGVVEGIGRNITQFQISDAVYGELAGRDGFGGFAEYVCAPEHALVAKPTNLSFVETAAVPMAGLTALQGLRDIGAIKAGQKVLIHGASGGVGTFAVQIAKAFGAEVTAVCSTSKMEIARSLGADHVIDYTQEDFAANGEQYDLILVANGKRSLSDYERALKPASICVMAGGSLRQVFQAVLFGSIKSRFSGKSVRDFTAKANQQDLLTLNELLESGKIAPFIDRCYPLAETPDAIRYIEAGHAKGKVVIMIAE